LNEQVQNATFDVNLKLDHANSDLMEIQIKEERAAAAIKELQDKLIEAKNDRKDMEIDYIGVKKNYWQVKM
jgi:4-hydroxy-3-methylbut-2-en-1-yl diphosphate synthase IspG/GcpE